MPLGIDTTDLLELDIDRLEEMLSRVTVETIRVSQEQTKLQDAFAEYKALDGELKGLGEVRGCLQSLLRSKRKALGD
jgi:hypothetical protein